MPSAPPSPGGSVAPSTAIVEDDERAPSGWLARILRPWHRLESSITSAALLAMVLLPIAEMVVRLVAQRGIPGSGPFVQHLTLWVGFLGAALAAREDKLLALATGKLLPEGKWRNASRLLAGLVGAAVSTALAWASWELVAIERDGGAEIALGVEVWVGQIVLPIAFVVLALRLCWRSSGRWWGRGIALLGVAVGTVVAHQPELLDGRSALPGLVVLLVATVLGGPIFVAIGGAALVLFLADGIPAAAIPVETYRLSVSQYLAAIPLFTLTGFLLAEGRASERLLEVFRALFGWIPGGTAVVCAMLCAFFTVFTGGSGVTILALGGLLLQALLADRYPDRFSVGLLTASGSLGLLLPPALPLILFGIVAEISIEELFIGGILPGILLVVLIAAWGMRVGIISRAQRTPFEPRRAARSLWQSKWELLLPVFVVVAFLGGYATLVEVSALAAFFALIIQCVIHRDVSFSGVPRVLHECAVLVGGVLIILGVAMGLTSYLVDAQVAQGVLELVRDNIESKFVFLLCLNVFLLVVGCLMDIFSATMVVVPLILPLGAAFGIHPVHLGIIFIANLELGYLTPPVGLNLFLASYRFNRPLLEVYRASLPAFLILGVGVLLITYFPWLTLGILEWLGRV
ncbi:MAG TPA: TRAP transporter large permease subunit [Thermoanaerobaculia bacterium]|nr:TRAP transporter large permease subunit [Thermoanaerobaculia bacterium]